jgi:hypothetical protein
MGRTRKTFGRRKSMKLNRKNKRSQRTKRTKKNKFKRGGTGGIRPYSASANLYVEGVGGKIKSTPLQYKGGRKSRIKRGGSGVTSSSIYSHATMSPSAYKSLPAEIPVSTTRKELGGYFPFERNGLKY